MASEVNTQLQPFLPVVNDHDDCKKKKNIESKEDDCRGSCHALPRERTKVTSTATLLTLGAALISFVLALISHVWVVSLLEQAILSNLALTPRGPAFPLWSHPPVDTVMNFYVFNVTNAKEYLEGKARSPLFNEVGPFTYNVDLRREETFFDNNDAILHYRSRHTYFSTENETDERAREEQLGPLVVANVPLFGAMRKLSSQSVLAKSIFRHILEGMNDNQPFISVPSGHHLWFGYPSDLITLAEDEKNNDDNDLFDFFEDEATDTGTTSTTTTGTFGIFVQRNHSLLSPTSIHTGKMDLGSRGRLLSFDSHEQRVNFWRPSSCNDLSQSFDPGLAPVVRLPSSSHSSFPRLLNFFIGDLCRSIPFEFTREVHYGPYAAWRFEASPSIFHTHRCHVLNEGEEKETFRKLSGFQDLAGCIDDSPILISWPQEHQREDFDPDKHSFFFDIEPRFGVTLAAMARIQLNVAVADLRSDGLGFFDKVSRKRDNSTEAQIVEESQVFPIAWMEEGVAQPNEFLMNQLFLLLEMPAKLSFYLTLSLVSLGTIFLVAGILCHQHRGR